jgi:hypothetical protein
MPTPPAVAVDGDSSMRPVVAAKTVNVWRMDFPVASCAEV